MKRDLEEGQLKSNYDLHVAVQQLIINECNNSHFKKIYLNYRSILGIIIPSDYHQSNSVIESFGEEFEEGRRGPDLSPFEFNG